MKKNTLALTLIVKNEEHHIERVLENAHIFADEIVIVDTGSTDNTKKLAQKFTDKIYDFEWCDDFAKARNYGIQQCTSDFIMWLDADDIVTISEAKKINKLFNKKIDWDCAYSPYNYSLDKEGKTKDLVYRVRFFKNNKDIYFQYPIHEVLNIHKNIKIKKENLNINILHKPIKKPKNYSNRNIDILLKILDLEPYKNENRFWFLTGLTYKIKNKPEKAIFYLKVALYEKGRNLPKIVKSQHHYELALQYAKINKISEAKHHLKRSIKNYDLWREPFFLLGKIYFFQNKYTTAKNLFLKALNIKNLETKYLMIDDYTIYSGTKIEDWLVETYTKLKNYKKALKHTKKILKNEPKNSKFLQHLNIIEQKENKTGLKAINLNLSSLCGANCIFCPYNRGKSIKTKFMNFKVAKKIIDELMTKNFQKKHNIQKIEIGGNGDAFLNKDIIKILRYIKYKLPHIKIVIFTNFQNFTKELSKIILGEQLIDSVYCNVDSVNKERFYLINKLNLPHVLNNIKDFIKIRDRLNQNIPLGVYILSLHHYIQTIYRKFGTLPQKIKNSKKDKFFNLAEGLDLLTTEDDIKETYEMLKNILNVKKDAVLKPRIIGWAERENVDTSKINYQQYNCPNLNRIKNEAFIAPDGTWHACCFDSDNELKLGNIMTQSIDKIFQNHKRKKIIQMLENKHFKEIGGSCKTVNCCQS